MLTLTPSCTEKPANDNKNLSINDFSQLRIGDYVISMHRLHNKIDELKSSDSDNTQADIRTRKYYTDDYQLLWIDRAGIDHRADTLLYRLKAIHDIGFTDKAFRINQMEKDLQRIRNLNFDKDKNTVSCVLARLEYNLTKAYMRFVVGQKYGYINPNSVLNRCDLKDSDSTGKTYNHVFDVKMKHPDDAFYDKIIQSIRTDSINEMIRGVEPHNPLYDRYLAELHRSGLNRELRIKILCNLERSRWQQYDQPYRHTKYVMVNIPSFRLIAADGNNILGMRIGCGSAKTKTPLLNSFIFRMDINPQWIIPASIVKKDVARHAGSTSYFASRHYTVRKRADFTKVDVARTTPSMLQSNDYIVVQEGGKGNSLGRIIFRFQNNFSVFLHDTSTPSVFTREDRSVSHGCIRVEKPYELALFMLATKDDQMADRIKYSMTTDISDEAQKENPIDKKRLVSFIKVAPQIPLFITYYTLYPDHNGHLSEYDDIYGYDKAIYNALSTYLK